MAALDDTQQVGRRKLGVSSVDRQQLGTVTEELGRAAFIGLHMRLRVAQHTVIALA
jgi:hypothetical protein